MALADPTILAYILCIEEERVVARDNTIAHEGRRLQLPQSPLRAHYVKARVKVHEYPDETLAVFHGPRRIARYSSPPSRRGLATAEPAAAAQRRPALTASARAVSERAQVGTKKRPFDRTKKLTRNRLESIAPVPA